ncbi:major facilitator superfamily domain-containing protein [Phlyctochytrium arcticum]|nr:major facilitator superfamily domain-containing protein [Phlyctochytrium arcticum]
MATGGLPVTSRHWLLLFFACAVMYSNYYCYDIPAALNVPLQKWLGTPDATYKWQINLLYSVYSLPNIILPLVGGLLVDRQALFALGVQTRVFNLMLVGRMVFGAGGESLEVATSRITTDWFKGRGLGFAMSLHLSMARIAAASNDNFSPWLAERTSTAVATWFGFIVCLGSAACGAGMIHLNRPTSRVIAGVQLENQDQRPKRIRHRSVTRRRDRDSSPVKSEPTEHSPLLATDNSPTYRRISAMSDQSDSYYHDSPTNADGFYPIRGVNHNASALSQTSPFGKIQIEDDSAEGFGTESEEEEYDEEDETVHCSQLRGLSWSFWMLCLATIGLYGSSVPFFHICTAFFQHKWYPGDSQMAGTVMSIPDIVSAVGSPLCGLFIDYYGHRSTLLPIAGVLVLITHALLCWTTITPIFAMSILGVAYSVFASALWTCVPYLVGSHQIATAYGLVAVALNMSLALFPLVVARIQNVYPDSFEEVLMFFMALSVLAIALSCGLYISDARNGWILTKVHKIGARGAADEGNDEDDTGSLTSSPAHSIVDGELETQRSLLREEEADFEKRERRRRRRTGGGEDEDVTVKVVGDGVLVPAPHTHIRHHHHHHHHHATSPSARTSTASAGSPASAPKSPPVKCNCYTQMPATTSSRLSTSSPTGPHEPLPSSSSSSRPSSSSVTASSSSRLSPVRPDQPRRAQSDGKATKAKGYGGTLPR